MQQEFTLECGPTQEAMQTPTFRQEIEAALLRTLEQQELLTVEQLAQCLAALETET